MKMDSVKNYLLFIWIGAFLVLVTVLGLQTFGDHFQDKIADVWKWFAMVMAPATGVVVGALVSDAKSKRKADTRIAPWLITLATTILSTIYVLMAALVLVMGAFFPNQLPLEVMQRSIPYFAIVQGMITAFLAFFFRS